MELPSNKKLQRKRMMKYFVDATTTIIDSDGIDALSIRKVADLAGYNSATLYNYFTNLKHLTYFSCIQYLKEYADQLSFYLADASSPFEQYFKIWECFCTHAFARPEIYELLFFENSGEQLFDYSFKSYYEIFPEELTEEIKEYYDMMMENDIYTREFLALKKTCKKADISVDQQVLTHTAEMNVLIFRGMLSNVKNKGYQVPLDDAVKRSLLYMKQACLSFGLNP